MTFPSFGFVLAAAPERAPEAIDAFTRRGLACAPAARSTTPASCGWPRAADSADVWDLAAAPVTRPGPG